jgi:two-component system, NarL family, response regulator NreC
LSARLEGQIPQPKASRSSSQIHSGTRRRTSCSTAQTQRPHRLRPRSRRTSALITIVLAEEQHLIRQGIRCLLETEKDFKVVGDTGDGLQAVGLVRRLRPRILVIAVAMPGLNGLDVARQVREQSPATAVVMLSTYSKEQYVVQALRNGASGYVLKRARPSELARAIRQVIAGHRYLSEPLSRWSVRTWLRRAETGGRDAYDTLTGRERAVLQLVAEGHSSTNIAARFGISPRTVEAHRASLMRKMRFSHLVDIMFFAITRGILARAPFEAHTRTRE